MPPQEQLASQLKPVTLSISYVRPVPLPDTSLCIFALYLIYSSTSLRKDPLFHPTIGQNLVKVVQKEVLERINLEHYVRCDLDFGPRRSIFGYI